MNHSQILASIQHIRPNAQFVLRGETLEWIDSEQNEPTADEIEAGWVIYQAKVESDKAEAQAKRQALLDKLGITEDEARLLLGGN